MFRKIRTPTKHYEAKDRQKFHWAHFMLAIYDWAWGLPLRVAYICSETPIGGNYLFICKQLLFTESFGIRDVGCCSVLSALGHHRMQKHASPVLLASVSVSSALLYLRLFPWRSSISYGSSGFPKLCVGWGDQWRNPIEDWVFQGLSICVHCLIVGLCVCSYYRRMLLWWLPRKTLIKGDSKILLGVILLLCFFTKQYLFSPRSLTYPGSGSCPPKQSVRHGFYFSGWALKQVRYLLVTPISFETLLSKHILQAGLHCWSKGL